MCALRHSHSHSHSLPLSALTPADVRFLRSVADDTEDAPWMVMNDRQWRGASALFWSLETYALTHGQPWYAGGMLPLTYLPPGARRRKQVAPDVFVATTPLRGRDSLAIDEEGMPPFVLEAVSSSSVRRDLEEKTALYRLLGAREYAIVRLDLAAPRLEGYRREANGAWVVWTPDGEGRLWSEVLELELVVHGGEMLRTLPEETLARQQEAQARQQEAQARQQAETAQRRAEEEVIRLRAALERLARGGDETPDA